MGYHLKDGFWKINIDLRSGDWSFDVRVHTVWMDAFGLFVTGSRCEKSIGDWGRADWKNHESCRYLDDSENTTLKSYKNCRKTYIYTSASLGSGSGDG